MLLNIFLDSGIVCCFYYKCVGKVILRLFKLLTGDRSRALELTCITVQCALSIYLEKLDSFKLTCLSSFKNNLECTKVVNNKMNVKHEEERVWLIFPLVYVNET